MKWFLGLPMYVRITTALLVVGGFVVSCLWFTKIRESQEPTFLEVCWRDGIAHYPEGQEQRDSCPEGSEPLLWKKQAKTVYWSFEREFDVYMDSHIEAVNWVNRELGFRALEHSDSPDADIIILHGSVNSGTGAMSTSHMREGGRIRAIISVKVPGDIRQWMLEEEHELLHALGLAHDPSGIMSESLDEPNGMKIWMLHDKDRRALRDLLLTP